jgi:predicted ATPase
MRGQKAALTSRYGENLDANSHGEGFMKLFESRLMPNGLYLLDEPEAALSPIANSALLSMIKQMIGQGCQFIVATHSPILMAFPDASILSFDTQPIAEVAYDELEHVRLTRAFPQ